MSITKVPSPPLVLTKPLVVRLANLAIEGEVRVGEVAKTKAPLPVSSEITEASSLDVVAAKSDSLFWSKAKVPVALGRVYVLLAVRSELVMVPVKRAAPPVVTERAKRSSVAVAVSIVVPRIVAPPVKERAVAVEAPLPVTLDKVLVSAIVTCPEPLLVVVISVPAAIVTVPPCVIVELEPLVAAKVNKVPPVWTQVAQVRVNEPPKDTAPPPPKGEEVLMVTEELAKLALVIPAEPDKLALVRPEIVLEPAAMVLLVRVWVAVSKTISPEASGKVNVLSAVGLVRVRRASEVSAELPSKIRPVVLNTVFPAAKVGLAAKVAP